MHAHQLFNKLLISSEIISWGWNCVAYVSFVIGTVYSKPIILTMD